MWRRKQRARRWALTLLGFFAAAAFLGPLLLRSSSNPPAPALASQCAAEFASEWKQYTDSLSGAEAPLCLLSQRGACKSLLPHDLLRNCPPAARFQSCQWLPFSNAIELTVAIGVSSSARLPALVASLLSELEVHAELVFIADATEDTSCIKSVVAILEDLGVTCHICSGSQCDQTLRDTAAAPLLVALHDSITLMHGSLSTLLSTASKLPSSIVSASITAPDKSLAWGIPGSQGLTRVKQLPPLLLVGGKAHMLELPLGRMGRDAYSGRMWQAQGPAWTLSSAVVQRARGGPGLPLLRPMPLRHVLYIDTNLPTPDKDSGSKRTSALMSLMAEAGLAVTFQPLWPTDPKYAAELNAVGVRTLNPSYPPGWAADPTDYAVVFIARRYTYEQCYDAAKRAWPRARIVYDTVDLHFLREARIKMMGAAFNQDTDLQSQGTQEVITWLAESGAPAAEVNTVRQTELRFINQSDVTLVVSDQEVQVVRHYLPAAPVRILSNIMGASSRAAMAGTATDFERRSGFIFVGHMAHYPNQQAVLALMRYIVPEVQSSRSWQKRGQSLPLLHIVGSGSLPQDIKNELSKYNGIVMHGQLSDAQLDYLYASVRVAVAPLVSGAGVKGKVNQAMALGVPVVATTIAVEGMHAVSGHDCMVAHTLEELVQHLHQVYFDATLWQRLARNGRANINKHFAPEVAGMQLREVLQMLSIGE